ncbi:ABC transporter substrate-binding protein [bacterium]|nr:ABC transporter substrate-binding protein [bacterium]
MKRICIGMTALVLTAMLVVTGCKKEKEEELALAPYKVGAVFAVTGPASWLGEPEKNTAEMIAKQINDAGGINGHPLELIVEDTTGEETATVNAMKKLVDKDGVCAVIGPSRSGTSMAIINIAEDKKVPLVSCAAAAAIVVPVKKWVFKVPQMDSDCVRRIYDYMKEKGWTKAAIITGTTGFGAAGRDQLIKLAKEYNMEIVADETYGPKDTDMTVQLTKIKAANAQALINWSIVPGQSTVIKNARQLGLTIPLFQSHGFGNIEYVKAAGAAAEGVLFPAGALLGPEGLPDDDPQKKLLLQYKNDYETKYSDAVSTFGGHAYDALTLVVKALKAVGDDRAKIRDHIENTTGFVGTAGVFNYSPQDHCGLDKTAFVMYTVKAGKFVPVEE